MKFMQINVTRSHNVVNAIDKRVVFQRLKSVLAPGLDKDRTRRDEVA